MSSTSEQRPVGPPSQQDKKADKPWDEMSQAERIESVQALSNDMIECANNPGPAGFFNCMEKRWPWLRMLREHTEHEISKMGTQKASASESRCLTDHSGGGQPAMTNTEAARSSALSNRRAPDDDWGDWDGEDELDDPAFFMALFFDI